MTFNGWIRFGAYYGLALRLRDVSRERCLLLALSRPNWLDDAKSATDPERKLRGSSRRIDFRPGLIRRERFDLTRDLGSVRSEVLLKHDAVVIDHEGHNA